MSSDERTQKLEVLDNEAERATKVIAAALERRDFLAMFAAQRELAKLEHEIARFVYHEEHGS